MKDHSISGCPTAQQEKPIAKLVSGEVCLVVLKVCVHFILANYYITSSLVLSYVQIINYLCSLMWDVLL